MKKIPDGSIDFVLTDPPYGTTACKWDTVIPFEPMWEQLKRITKKNGAIVLFGSQPFTSALVMSNVSMYRYELIWEKPSPSSPLLAKKMPMKFHENISVFYQMLPTYNPQLIEKKWKDTRKSTLKTTYSNPEFLGGKTQLRSSYGRGQMRYASSVLPFARPRGVHPTQKPVELFEWLIKTYTNEGETVLDFTMGSGTTGVACKNLNRNFIGIELDPSYFEIAKQRIEKAPEMGA
jgi:site-specific DNA-methyltransferase (adenine-specific)